MPPRVANRRRQSLRDVFRTMVSRAIEWPADALLIAGDLFELERVTRDTVAFLRAEFERMRPIPVILAPGNHDPFIAASPYATDTWPDNVHIFTRPQWNSVVLNGGALVVHGFAFDGYDVSSNPFGQLEVPEDGAVHVALAHGTERAQQPPDGKSYAPFDAQTAAPRGLAYFALGHFHRVTEIAGALPCPMWYCGAPEGHGFDEMGPHHYLEVEIDGGGTSVKPVPAANVIYTEYTVDCSGFATAQQLVEALRGLATSGTGPEVARVWLTGLCASSIASELAPVYDAVAANFEHLLLIDETLPDEDYEELAQETTTLGALMSRLNSEIRDTPDAARRQALERARQVGLAAYRDQRLPVAGIEGKGDRP
jgi:DNA repair exonuclease SbcCD nuclease subunit